MTYRPPVILGERLRIAAFNARRPQSEILNEALEEWLTRHGVPQNPATSTDEAFRENLEKVHTDRDVKIPKTAAELSRMSAETNARNAAAEPAEWTTQIEADHPGDDACPKCAFPVKPDRGQMKCSNKSCSYTRKI